MKSQKIECIVTGIEKRISASTIEKKSLKFGTFEAFKEHFVCNEAKKLLRQRVQPEKVQEQLLPQGKKPFSIDYHVLARLKLLKKEKKEKSKANKSLIVEYTPRRVFADLKEYTEWATGNDTCIRPDIYFDNEYNVKGNCAPCPYNEFCKVSNKILK